MTTNERSPPAFGNLRQRVAHSPRDAVHWLDNVHDKKNNEDEQDQADAAAAVVAEAGAKASATEAEDKK